MSAINRASIGLQKKNLFESHAVSKTVGGVLYTVDDGFINASGTTTMDSTFYCLQSGVHSPLIFDRDVIVSYTGDLTNILAKLRLEISPVQWPEIPKTGILVPANTQISSVYIQQSKPDVHVEVSKFAAMIRYADIADDTYEPYRADIQTRINTMNTNLYWRNTHGVVSTETGTKCAAIFATNRLSAHFIGMTNNGGYFEFSIHVDLRNDHQTTVINTFSKNSVSTSYKVYGINDNSNIMIVFTDRPWAIICCTATVYSGLTEITYIGGNNQDDIPVGVEIPLTEIGLGA